jgi:hypothetical protein
MRLPTEVSRWRPLMPELRPLLTIGSLHRQRSVRLLRAVDNHRHTSANFSSV